MFSKENERFGLAGFGHISIKGMSQSPLDLCLVLHTPEIMRLPLLLFLLICLTQLPSIATQVENFALIDHEGKFHEFDYYRRDSQVKGIVLFVQGNGCPLVRKRVPEIKRLRDAFQPRGVLFGMLNANPQDEREDLAEEAREYGMDIPILKDTNQLVARMLGIERTAEALLIDTKTCQVVFRGPIDDRMSYQTEKPQASEHYLHDALEALLGAQAIGESQIDAPGCRITFENLSHSTISYTDHVAPILKKRCVACHTRGGVGPFAMSHYKKVKGWSDMIAEVILTKQMPPWHADPHIGTFSNDSGLTDAEAQTIVSWIRAGSPRGEGDDPLAGFQPKKPEWTLGTPDKVISLPKQSLHAEGILEYRYLYIDSPFDQDVWIRGAEVKPGNTRVVHHVIVTTEEQSAPRRRGLSGSWVSGYAPGTDPTGCPEDTGILLRKGHRLNFEMHYTVSGKPEEDETQLGIYLLDKPPAKRLRTRPIAKNDFLIEPNDPESTASHTVGIDQDIIMYGVNPHMHLRGKRMRFTLLDPAGNKQPLLSVPNYNFNWQRTYHFAEPVRVAAGSRLLVENAWDNSKLNLHNPNANKPVTWGDQSSDEMFFATYTYVTVE